MILKKLMAWFLVESCCELIKKVEHYKLQVQQVSSLYLIFILYRS